MWFSCYFFHFFSNWFSFLSFCWSWIHITLNHFLLVALLLFNGLVLKSYQFVRILKLFSEENFFIVSYDSYSGIKYNNWKQWLFFLIPWRILSFDLIINIIIINIINVINLNKESHFNLMNVCKYTICLVFWY